MLKTKKAINFLSGWPHSKKKKNLSHVMLQTMGFLSDKTKKTPFLAQRLEEKKNRQTQRGYDVFLYPLPLQDDGG